MQQLRLLCVKRTVLFILLAAVCTTAAARTGTKYKKGSGIQHYITLSLSGGEGNMMTRALDDYPFIHNNVGADGQLHIGYELRQRNFVFGLGVGGDTICIAKASTRSRITMSAATGRRMR